MAAVGSVWPQPPTVLRILVDLAAAAADLPRQLAGIALGMGALFGAALVGRRVLRRSYLGPLLVKSRVLSGATVTLHGVRSAPVVADERRRGRESRHYHVLDVTVKPRPDQWRAQRWTPGDLVLVAPGALPARPEEDEVVGRIYRAECWVRGRFVEADGSGLFGPQRLRLHVGLLPSERRFHLRYYLELLRRTPAF
jgi:hypothetical protein